MGVERSVTRWYVQRQQILIEIAGLEASLLQKQAQEQSHETQQVVGTLSEQLAQARSRLRSLGPCPTSMMG